MENPFSISFGRINEKVIQRDKDIEPIFEDFNSTHSRNTVYILTGPRGSGKTVTLAHILDTYREKDNWVVARINQNDNILEQLASLLYEYGALKIKTLKVEFSFSFSGISFNVKGDKPVSSIEIYLKNLFEYFKKKNIHVLIAIDDVSKNNAMVNFIRAYQGFLIDHYDIRLLMTGLSKNISKLENDKSLTFLFRAPKICLSPLSIPSIAFSYEETFNISEEESIKLAKTTKGYALAYQVLGDILYRNNEKSLSKRVLKEFDIKMSDWSYEIIWNELTNSEKEILSLIAEGFITNEEITSAMNISNGNLAIYKSKLAKEGLIDVSKRGKTEFLLPRFKEFIELRKKFEL